MDDVPQTRILLDTNVWLDLFLPNRTGRADANRLVRRCAQEDIIPLYAFHAIQDVFYQAGLTYKRMLRAEGVAIDDTWARAISDQAWDCTKTMRELATAASVGEGDLWIAEKYRDLHADLEDDVVIAVALRVKADYLVTSDKRLLTKSPVAALTPADMLTVLAAQG